MSSTNELFGDRIEIVVEFGDETGPIRPEELSNFFYYLKIGYSGLSERRDEIQAGFYHDFIYEETPLADSLSRLVSDRDWVTSEVRNNIYKSDLTFTHLFWKRTDDDDLKIERIRKASPLVFVLSGTVLVLLLLAITGGEAEANVSVPIADVEADLRVSFDKTLGQGLEDLKEAFRSEK